MREEKVGTGCKWGHGETEKDVRRERQRWGRLTAERRRVGKDVG